LNKEGALINRLINCTFITFVDQILAITKDNDYLQNPDKQVKIHDLEKHIDQMVYKLYDLAPEEIAIVEE
jgi:hypothetical protein